MSKYTKMMSFKCHHKIECACIPQHVTDALKNYTVLWRTSIVYQRIHVIVAPEKEKPKIERQFHQRKHSSHKNLQNCSYP